jgi:hypothetical protein
MNTPKRQDQAALELRAFIETFLARLPPTRGFSKRLAENPLLIPENM